MRNKAIEMHVCKLSMCLEKLKCDRIYVNVINPFFTHILLTVVSSLCDKEAEFHWDSKLQGNC